MHLFALCKYPSVLPFGAGMAGKPKLCSKNRAFHCVAMGLKVMKITAVILLATCLQAAAAGYGQKVTISEKDAPVEKIFSLIRKQTGFQFLYANQVLAQARKVTIQVKNAELEDVLATTCYGQPFEYHIKDKTIIVRMRAEPASMSAADAAQPPVDVRGRVVNENGDPVEGVSVSVKGTSIVTSTNANGEFSLKGVEENATLVFTSVNTEVFEARISKRSFMDVALQNKITSMREVVVNKGYYTEKKMFATGNVSTVKGKDIQNQPVNNPLLALVGRVPGVTVEQQTGFANSGVLVRVQGRNSINSGLEPLYVIDGVPYLQTGLPTLSSASLVLGSSGTVGSGGNPLSFINPGDIESIDILKDADATAIYGSRGANGVILITTKKGNAGKTSFNVNVRSGWGRVVDKVDLLNTEQYLEMRKEGYNNDGLPVPNESTTPNNNNYDLTVWDQSRYTDWQKELLGGTARYTDAQFNISGGNNNTQFLIGAGYHKETTVFPGSYSDRKGSIHINVNHGSNDQKFKTQVSLTYVVDNNQIPQTDITQYAIKIAPNAPELYNEDGTLNWQPLANGTSTWINPLAYLQSRYTNKVNNVIGNAMLSYQILPKLIIKSSFGYTRIQSDEVATSPLTATRPELRPNTNRGAGYSNGSNESWIIEPQATYQLNIAKGVLEVLAGGSFQQNNANRQQFQGLGYSSDLLMNDIRAASTVTVQSSLASIYKYNAVFGRLNYNLLDKYVVNVTARRDGSSRFGPENLFNNFWGIAGSWLFSKEKLLSNLSWLEFGKLRVSYGTSGNDQIGDYKFMNLYSPYTSGIGIPYQGVTVLSPAGHTNPYLQWEATRKLQFGLDVGLLHDRLQLNVNYYMNRSSNLLVNNKLSAITGFDNINRNFEGVVENSGWEFALSTTNVKSRNFSWITNINFTVPIHNGYLKSFPNLANTVYANQYTVGKSLYDVKSYHSWGVDPTTGKYQFEDANGNVTFSPTTTDLISYRNTTAQLLFGGMQNTLRYKRFELDFTFQFVKKDANKFLGDDPGLFVGVSNQGNEPVVVLDRWQKTGEEKDVQRFTGSGLIDLRIARSNYFSSDGVLTDASFTRLTNMSLSYQLDDKWARRVYLQNARVFVQGQNLFTITSYNGLNPATTSSSILPPLQVITVGAGITF